MWCFPSEMRGDFRFYTALGEALRGFFQLNDSVILWFCLQVLHARNQTQLKNYQHANWKVELVKMFALFVSIILMNNFLFLP